MLEHLERPAAALGRIHDWLAPGGGLLLGVPNLDSWQARLSGDRWYHLDVPRHRTHFTVAGASALLARSGFDVLAVHHHVLEHNPYGMWQSAVSRATRHPSYLYNLLKRNAPLSVRDLAVTGAGAGPGARRPPWPSWSPEWPGAGGRSRCWRGVAECPRRSFSRPTPGELP